MKLSLLRITLALLVVLTLFGSAALAAEALSVQIGAQITLEGTLPAQAETYVIRMTADSAANPMPNGRRGGSCELTVTGAGSAVFPPMCFDALGEYRYTLVEVPGSNADCSYDGRTYRLTISVVNGEKGGYELEVALRENGKTEKTNTALFHNVYRTIEATPKPTTRPGKITATGVNDRWPMYAGGAALLLAAAAGLVRRLRRGEDEQHEKP